MVDAGLECPAPGCSRAHPQGSGFIKTTLRGLAQLGIPSS